MAMTTPYSPEEPPRPEIDSRDGPVVVEFGTNWCGFCQAAQPLIANAFSGFENIEHIKVEDGPGRPLGRSFRVKLWPTLIFMRHGKEVERLVRPADAASVRDALARIAA